MPQYKFICFPLRYRCHTVETMMSKGYKYVNKKPKLIP
jgi:hypothetical protein